MTRFHIELPESTARAAQEADLRIPPASARASVLRLPHLFGPSGVYLYRPYGGLAIFWRSIMSIRTVTAIWALVAVVQPARAADPAAQLLAKLFTTVCIPNLGQPTRVREWAQERHLGEIQNPVALSVFVGSGDKGTAWAIPVAEGSFVLSIRGTTQACAVWARAANPGDVLALFRQIIEGVRRPGIEVTVDMDTVTPSPAGEAHALVYNVTAPGAPTSFELTLLTAERTGGPFQASMQAAKAGPHQTPAR
jgi:hypothetical protein